MKEEKAGISSGVKKDFSKSFAEDKKVLILQPF